MPRPIVWACGLLVSATVTGLTFGDRLGPLGLAPTRSPAATGTVANPIVVLNADLRGHYMVHPSVEGRTLRMMVDTGASSVALTYEDAERAGIKLAPRDFNRPVGTANGVAMAASVRIAELKVGEIRLTFVDAMVLPRGKLGTSLLGMSFLKRLKGFEVASGRLTLRG
jgi:aspartyl protease family protein